MVNMLIPELPHKICYSQAEADKYLAYALDGCEDGDTARIVPNADNTRFIIEIVDPQGQRVMLF